MVIGLVGLPCRRQFLTPPAALQCPNIVKDSALHSFTQATFLSNSLPLLSVLVLTLILESPFHIFCSYFSACKDPHSSVYTSPTTKLSFHLQV